MARILGDLTVRLEDGGRMWRLQEPLAYHVGSADSGHVIEVPAGFQTDLASVPWFRRWLVSSWKGNARAAVVHDYLYAAHGRRRYGLSRSQADGIFLEALGVTGAKHRWLMWAAVRLWGGTAWRCNGQKDPVIFQP